MKENKLKIAITTLGCKVNQYESSAFQNRFEAEGHTLVPFAGEADVYVINTCAVTAKAGMQSRQMIRRAHRANPAAKIVVTGCYAQIASQEILELGGESICLVGNGFKDQLADIALSRKSCDLEMYMGDIGRKKEICPLPTRRFPGRTRAYLKIQDGCNRFCSYCIVPYSRGRSRSLPPEKVLEQLDVFVAEDYKEVVLTGIHAGGYGRDLEGNLDFFRLLTLIAAKNHPVRYRLSSLEPSEISEELLRFLAETPSFTPHLHIPLQSGDDEILRRMNRRYTVKEFRAVIQRCHALLPDAAIGIDVMAGFPGETEQAFANTLALLESLPVTYLHVFPYSKRPGTAAAGMDEQVPEKSKEERVALLKELDHKKRSAFYGRHLGRTHQVLSENRKNRFRLMKGFTENYIPVHFSAAEHETNQVLEVTIERIMDLNVFGTKTS